MKRLEVWRQLTQVWYQDFSIIFVVLGLQNSGSCYRFKSNDKITANRKPTPILTPKLA